MTATTNFSIGGKKRFVESDNRTRQKISSSFLFIHRHETNYVCVTKNCGEKCPVLGTKRHFNCHHTHTTNNKEISPSSQCLLFTPAEYSENYATQQNFK